MQNFIFQTTKTIITEFGAADRLGEIVSGLGVSRPLIITDPGILDAGLLTRAVNSMEKAGLDCCSFTDVLPDPPEKTVLDAVSRGSDFRADGVIGFGGGSSMDVAKVTAFLLNSSQSLTEIFGVGQARGPRLPLVQVPTTAGTGSEVTATSVLSTGGLQKKSVVAPQLLADVAILDPDLTLGLPPNITAATGMDAMVHAIEAYTSKIRKNPTSDMLAKEALRLLTGNIRTAVVDGSNRQARANMLLGSMYAGQAFGNATVGAVHAFAHTLGAHFHIPHGLANSLMLPPVMRFNLPVSMREYAELAAIILPDSGKSDELLAHRLIEELENMAAELNLETRLNQLGITEEQLTVIAGEAMKEERILSFNSRQVTHEDALAMFRQAL